MADRRHRPPFRDLDWRRGHAHHNALGRGLPAHGSLQRDARVRSRAVRGGHPGDAHGVLQDVHWAGGTIGYFPTYALGNLIAGQLWERAHLDILDLDEQIAAGELMPLREWLRTHIHCHGGKFTSAELLERVVGAPVSVKPFITYLKGKLSEVYGVKL